MFGLGKEKSTKDEAEERRIEALKASIEAALMQMKKQAEAGLTDRCEASSKRLTEILKNPKLPNDFAKQARGGVDALMLHVFMKATALASKAAIDAAMADDAEKRSEKVKEAREKLAGAIKYKAPKEFKLQCERMLEVAMFSGGVKAKGPTKAKPLDTAPKVENRAKSAEVAEASKSLEKHAKPVGV